MKRLITICTVIMMAGSISGCCTTLEQAVRVNTEKSRELAKVVYGSDIVDPLKKEIVFNYASLRCMREIMDNESTASKETEACLCQRYGSIDFSKCQTWFNK